MHTHPYLPALFLGLLALLWSVFLYCKRGRLAEIFRRWDTDMVEMGLIAATYWQAWRFAVMLGWLPPVFGEFALPFTAHGVNLAGADVSRAVTDYWVVMMGGWLPAAFWALLFVASMNLLGLIEKKTKTRLVSTALAQLWWIGAALAFTIHTPAHDGGGLYAIIGGGAYFATVQLWAKKNAEKRIALVSRIITWQKSHGAAWVAFGGRDVLGGRHKSRPKESS